MPIVVEACCSVCGGVFAFDWPAGHALLHPALVDRQTGAVYADGSDWYVRRFVRCLATQEAPASLEINVSGACREGRRAIVVNCLDFVYSHVLLKLMSAARHVHESPEDDVVVIVPKLLKWLVPPAAVVVEVDFPMGPRGTEWAGGLDAVVEDVLAPSAEIRISPAVSQPEVGPLELAALAEDLTPSPAIRSAGPLQIGFALRNDRQWLASSRSWLRIAERMLPSRLAQAVVLRQQHRNYADLARRIREQHPGARFIAFGMGRPGGLPAYVDDLRTPGPTREERAWLDEYRRCHVVVGVHGATMLLPSLLGGAVVNLIRAYQLPNIAQDLIVPRGDAPDPKLALFRYRFLPEESTPETVAATVLSVVDDADWFHRNMIGNRCAYEKPGWVRPITWRKIAL
jgi:hypothetical protein